MNFKCKDAAGGVVVRAVLATVTLLVIGALIVVMLQRTGQRQEADHRIAVRVSEYGLQEALNRLNETPSWSAGFAKTPYDGGYYTVSLRRFARNDTIFLEVKSEGSKGAFADVKECLLARIQGSADSAWIPQGIR